MFKNKPLVVDEKCQAKRTAFEKLRGGWGLSVEAPGESRQGQTSKSREMCVVRVEQTTNRHRHTCWNADVLFALAVAHC